MIFARTICIVAWMLSITAWSQEAMESKPYANIVARNTFDLLPILPPPPVEPALELPKITPTGITSIFGKWLALFTVAGKGESGKPRVDAFMLGEGQSQSEIEVIQINPKEGLITFRNHGTIQQMPLALAGGLTTSVVERSW
jgi:hypothetical protein